MDLSRVRISAISKHSKSTDSAFQILNYPIQPTNPNALHADAGPGGDTDGGSGSENRGESGKDHDPAVSPHEASYQQAATTPPSKLVINDRQRTAITEMYRTNKIDSLRIENSEKGQSETLASLNGMKLDQKGHWSTVDRKLREKGIVLHVRQWYAFLSLFVGPLNKTGGTLIVYMGYTEKRLKTPGFTTGV